MSLRVHAISDLTHKAHYRYQPFKNTNLIRMLVLEPGQLGEPLSGTLETIPIDSAGIYEAISYVWADPGPTDCVYEIFIHDKKNNKGILTFRGGSIFAALRQLRLTNQSRRLWADQCCINQDDLAERSQQVQFMDRIYRNANRTLVWLGLDKDNRAASAFHLVRKLDKALSNRSAEGLPFDDKRLGLERQIKNDRQTLQALTDLAWFKRGWIVQEIGTITPATMIWGDATLDWDTLASVCERLKGYHHLRSTLHVTTSDISFLYRRFIEPDKRTHHANRFNFIYELQRSRHLHFSDDRDRVFAFLGHFSVHSPPPLGCGPVSVVADYSKTVEQTYIDVAIRVLSDCPSVACIMLAAVQHARYSLPSSNNTTQQPEKNLQIWLDDDCKLPSWVPDWRRSMGIILAEPISPHRAHGNTALKFNIAQGNDLTLQVHGVRFDVIEVLSHPLLSREFYGKRTQDQPLLMIQRLWKEICMKDTFNLVDKYHNDETAFYAFMQTLSNGCVQAAGHESKPYDSVPDQIWLQKAARYLTSILGPSRSVSDEVQKLANESGSEDEHETWSRWATSASDSRVFARTARGYYVLGPAALEVGDVVCVLFGCKVPFCLRPFGSRFLLVGECYVHGLMKGALMDMLALGEVGEQIFEIV